MENSVEGFEYVEDGIETALYPPNFGWDSLNAVNYLTEVVNQNTPYFCKSGWVFAPIAVLNDRLKISRNVQSPDILVSPQPVLSCPINSNASKQKQNQGCYGGTPELVYQWIKQNTITDISCAPYLARAYSNGAECQEYSSCYACYNQTINNQTIQKCVSPTNYEKYNISNYGSVTGEDEIMHQIYNFGPVACGIVNTTAFANYSSGILEDSEEYGDSPDHYVEIVGWGTEDEKTYWLCKNSWGRNWGINGYFKILRGQNTLRIEEKCTYGDISANITVLNSNLVSTGGKDWRVTHNSITPVLNQNSPNYCNSSFIIATLSSLQDRYMLINHRSLSQFSLSVQSVINLIPESCKGGSPNDVYEFGKNYEFSDSACNPYLASPLEIASSSEMSDEEKEKLLFCQYCEGPQPNSSGSGEFGCTPYLNPIKYNIKEVVFFNGESEMKSNIRNKGPITCRILATYEFEFYTGGIFSQQIEGEMYPNHTVSVIGWGTEGNQSFWILKNSFGSYWGEKGFMRLEIGENSLGIENDCSAAEISLFHSSKVESTRTLKPWEIFLIVLGVVIILVLITYIIIRLQKKQAEHFKRTQSLLGTELTTSKTL